MENFCNVSRIVIYLLRYNIYLLDYKVIKRFMSSLTDVCDCRAGGSFLSRLCLKCTTTTFELWICKSHM